MATKEKREALKRRLGRDLADTIQAWSNANDVPNKIGMDVFDFILQNNSLPGDLFAGRSKEQVQGIQAELKERLARGEDSPDPGTAPGQRGGIQAKDGGSVNYGEIDGKFFIPDATGGFGRLPNDKELFQIAREKFGLERDLGRKVTDQEITEFLNESTAAELEGKPYRSEFPEHIEKKLIRIRALRDPRTFRNELFEGIEQADENRLRFIDEVLRKTNAPEEDLLGVQQRIRQKEIERERVASEQEVEQFLLEAPQEAARNREAFLNRQADLSRQFLTEEAGPSILRSLNARSPLLVRGGQVAGQFGIESEAVASRLQEIASQLSEEDFNFFSNAAYQFKIQQLADAGASARGELQFQREEARTAQENAFGVAQNALTRDLSLDLFRRQQERALQTQIGRQRVQDERTAEANKIKTFAEGAQVAAQVGTAAVISRLG